MYYKASLHVHSLEDKSDGIKGSKIIKHNAKELIDKAYENDFKIISFTLHNYFFYPSEIQHYARKKGIFLIPGIEKSIEGKHILILGADKNSEKLKTWDDLKKYKNRNKSIITIAAHPFRAFGIGQKEIDNYINLIDLFELSWFDLPFNLIMRSHVNKKLKKIAEKFNKKCISTADVHHLDMLNFSYVDVNIDGELNYENFRNAILNGNYKNRECDLQYRYRLRVVLGFFFKISTKELKSFMSHIGIKRKKNKYSEF